MTWELAVVTVVSGSAAWAVGRHIMRMLRPAGGCACGVPCGGLRVKGPNVNATR
jgi:hypothetical protein